MTYDDKICEVCGDTTMTTPFLGMECCGCGKWICEECTDVHYMMSVSESEPVCTECSKKYLDETDKVGESGVFNTRKNKLVADMSDLLSKVNDEDQYDELIEAIAQAIEYDQFLRNKNIKY